MEGLLIAEVLRDLEPHLPAERLAFRFLDPDTVVLPVQGGPSLWIFVRPPHPRLELRAGAPPASGPETRFQELLVSRAGGPLVAAEQRKLDRVATLRFGSGEGFVTTEPAELIVELTGRNCNLILTDPGGTILGAAREVTSDINRYRQIRPGLAYTPPPPYDKLDPREAPREALADAIGGKKLKNLRKAVDGVGPDLTEAVARVAGVPLSAAVEGEDRLERVLDALERVTAEPSATMRDALELPDVETLRARERRAALLERARELLAKRVDLTEKRIGDSERTIEAADEAAALRGEADLLMAYAHEVPDHAETARLTGFDGEPIELELDPRLDAVGNAEARYRSAKKRERRAERALERGAELRDELGAWRDRAEAVEAQSTDDLETLVEELAPTRQAPKKRGPGVRYRAPHGFTVVVGRSAKENDAVTFDVARSRDLWLHVQGYHGAHVVVLAQNKEVPFDTVIYAAKLAAAYSKAAGGENVPVDYTTRKNVWKVKGMPAGAVHFTQQKTVYVTPDRHPKGGEVIAG